MILLLAAVVLVGVAGARLWRRERQAQTPVETATASAEFRPCTDADLLATWRTNSTNCLPPRPVGWVGLSVYAVSTATSGDSRLTTRTATYDDAFGYAKIVCQGAWMLPNEELLRLLSPAPPVAHAEERVFIVARDLASGTEVRRTLRSLLFYDKLLPRDVNADHERLLDSLRSQPNGATGAQFNVDLGAWLADRPRTEARFAVYLEAGERRSPEVIIEVVPRL